MLIHSVFLVLKHNEAWRKPMRDTDLSSNTRKHVHDADLFSSIGKPVRGVESFSLVEIYVETPRNRDLVSVQLSQIEK